MTAKRTSVKTQRKTGKITHVQKNVATTTRGRKSKYTPAVVSQIVSLLSKGCIIADVCAKVGINQDTYFEWIKRYPEFSEKVTRAKARANNNAVLSLRKAMLPHDIGSETVKTLSETKLRKARVNVGTEDDPKYAIEEQPYTYTKTERSRTTSNEFDWRAALEFLKRRDPDNWSEAFIIKVAPEDADLLKQLGFKSAGEAFAALIDNARREYEEAHRVDAAG